MRLTIAALAAITPVGRDFANTCAAIRAGLSRPRPISYLDVVDEETHQEIPLTGHPVAGFAEGFNLVGFWLRMGTACLRDLLKEQPRGADTDYRRRTAWRRRG